MTDSRTYLCIDLKSFYASVECVERGLDPLTTNLVVADASRTEKTICLAVSPSLKALGIAGRPRLFEVVEKVAEVNARRSAQAPGRRLTGASDNSITLSRCPEDAVAYITAPPRMALYMAYSSRVYQVYLRFVAPEDIHVYSIDEVMIDLTGYLGPAGLSAREMTRAMIAAVFEETGVTATAGIGANLYLSKVAMDILAKRAEPDEHGARIAELDERGYREQLWEHRPLTDFWRVGRGYAKKLEAHGLYTMGDIARCSAARPGEAASEDMLYRLFGVNAELLIDHAWGCESCTMADIKAYKPDSSSTSTGQVLSCPYPWDKARLIVREMAEGMALDLLEKGLTAAQVDLAVGYDVENLLDPARRLAYRGEVVTDFYGRQVPKPAHGSARLARPTASARRLTGEIVALFDRVADPRLLVRRITVCADGLRDADAPAPPAPPQQLDLFTDYDAAQRERDAAEEEEQREERVQRAMLDIRRKFGKNAILKGTSLEEGATAMIRNRQIGGHQA